MEDRTYTADAEPGTEVTVAGWAHELRDLGGIAFLIVRDRTGKIQVKFAKDEMDDDLVEAGTSVARESVVKVTGSVEEEPRAPTGVEVVPESVEVVAPAEPELPLDPSGKVDAELPTRLDNRTLDLRREEAKAVFEIRSAVLAAARDYLHVLDAVTHLHFNVSASQLHRAEQGIWGVQPVLARSANGVDLTSRAYWN